MKIVKFILFILSMFFIVFLANFLQFNKQKSDRNKSGDIVFNTSSLAIYEYGDIKSLASIYFNTKQEVLSSLFNTNAESIQNVVLSKSIKIEDVEGSIVLFAGEHRIEQITVLIEPKPGKDISKISSEIKAKVSLNAPAEIEEIENTDGVLEVIITRYNASKYNLIITEYFDTTNTSLTIDLQNDIYGY